MATLPRRRGLSSLPRAITVALGAILATAALTATAHAASAQGSSATLTASATSLPNGANISFTYSAPAAVASPYNVVAITDLGAAPNETNVVSYKYAPGTGGTVS